MTFHTYSDVEAWLDTRPQFRTDGARATDMRPAKIVEFCGHLGHPERTFKTVHVAGTNGKGTTCSMLASVFAQAGYKTGLYTSPHVEFWRERIKIDGVPAGEPLILEAFQTMAAVEGFAQLTYFELATVAGFLVFSGQKVDVAVIEVGMGGRLDATNVIIPQVSVITSIGFDHAEYLGTDLGSIAREKAGIIKPGIPVVAGNLPEEAMEVVRHVAHELRSPLHLAADLHPAYEESEGRVTLAWAPQPLKFIPDVASVTSAVNAATAAQAVRVMRGDFAVNDSHLVAGLRHAARNTGLRGRMERLNPEWNWYYDGAHNEEALNVLVGNVERIAPLDRWLIVFTLMKDKATPDALALFNRFGHKLFWAGDNPRAAAYDTLKTHIPNLRMADDDQIVAELSPFTKEFVIFSGSFYFYNEVRRWMRMISAKSG